MRYGDRTVKNFRSYWLVLGALLLVGQAFGQSFQDHVSAKAATFEKKSHAAVGVSVVDVASGKPLAQYHQDDLFMPASNMKVVTTTSAMLRLGADYQFKTTVYVLGNDVIVVGSFDPMLGDPVVAAEDKKSIYADLDIWATAVKHQLGDKVGDVIVLTSRPVKTYRHADWPANQHARWYSAPVAELDFNNNCIDVTFDADASGVTPVLSPSSKFFTVNNKLKAAKGAAWNLGLSNDDSVLTLTGTAARNATPQPTAVNDPPMLLARTFGDRLEKIDVKVTGKIRSASPSEIQLAKAAPVVQTTSPLTLAVKRCNKKSLNMAAECLFLAAGDGTWEGSANQETATLINEVGLKDTQFKIADGSGYSRNNRVSPAAMTTILCKALAMKGSQSFVDSLPVSGTDGSLESRIGGEYKGRVLGKTGYIAGVSCLSGFILDKQGKPVYAYSILVNKNADLTGARNMQAEICENLVDSIK